MDAKRIKSELTTIAESRLKYYQELVTLADAQREILVQGKHADLAENLKKHDPILLEISRLDQREEVLLALGIEVDMDQDHQRMLRSTAATAAQLAKLTRINAELLENAREFVAFSIGVINKTMNEQQSSNTAGDSGGSLLLDMKV